MLSPVDVITLTLPAELSNLYELGEKIRNFVARVPNLAEPEVTLYNIELAVQEIAVNIVNHSYARSGGQIHVSARLGGIPLQLTIELKDAGISFNPDDIPEPRLGELQEHGFGLFLVRQLMDRVEYDSAQGRNCWTLVKILPLTV